MSDERIEGRQPIGSPGEAIQAAMEQLGWLQADLAFVLGVTTATINQVITGKRGVSPSMAKALGSALNMPPETLARLQIEWELHQADEPAPIVGARARVLSRYPLREMIRRGWITETADPVALERQVCRFFDVSSLDEVPHLVHAAKRGSPFDEVPPAQLPWLFRVRQLAAETQAAPYSPTKLEHALARLADARGEPEGVRYVPKLMREAGIRFVIVEALPNSDIDGVCLWLGDSPVIGMSLRFDRIDNFWFVFGHECAHVLHGHGKSKVAVDADLYQTIDRETSKEEEIANKEAANFCVPQEQMTSFYLRKNPLFSERDVLAFAKRIHVHPGLVVGQLQRKTNRYDLLRRHLVRIRDKLAMSIMMDGWGDIIPVEQ